MTCARASQSPSFRTSQTTLLALLQDETASLDARGHAAVTLGHLGAQATPETKHALLMLLQKEHIHDSLLSSTAAAMEALGTHMPPEAAPVLVRIIRTAAAEAAAPAPPAAPDPFAPGESPPAATFDNYQPQPVEYAVPALGNLGDKLPPEAQQVLLEAVKHAMGNAQTPWHAALALARMGDKLPPQMQQSLLALLRHPGIEYQTRLALRRTLGVCGIHPISDAQLADVLASTYLPSNSYDGAPDADLRTYLYLWLGRSPTHLQAVRWLAQAKADPPQSDTAPQQILTLITHLWPHTIQSGTGTSTDSAAALTALRQQMARRTTQILTTHEKTRPLDEPTRQALRTLTTQLAADPAPDCATALQHAQAALAADEKAR